MWKLVRHHPFLDLWKQVAESSKVGAVLRLQPCRPPFKVVSHNCFQIFQPYAKFWLRPLCQLILSTGLCENGLNYFIVDLVVTMLSWHDTAIPQVLMHLSSAPSPSTPLPPSTLLPPPHPHTFLDSVWDWLQLLHCGPCRHHAVLAWHHNSTGTYPSFFTQAPLPTRMVVTDSYVI